MTLNLRMPEQPELKPRITVFGVGGAGGNAVNNMIEKALDGVEFVTANTDAQALQHSKAQAKIQMGVKATEGLGAGARPSVGASAAEETIEEIVDHLAGAHMCFITAGMGGGTGTGAAPIIAQAARELGVLTVGVVTKPFQFEGGKRMKQADEGIEALQKVVDTLIIIPNQNLFRLANEKTTFTEAFSMADDVLYQGVKGVTDLMVRPGLINLDFADVRAVMDEMGKAMMGTGEAEGEDRAIQAAEKAIANPLLDEISLRGAKGVLINITGSHDLTLFELDEAANRIREEVDPDANIIVGSTLDTDMDGKMRVSVVATGIEASEELLAHPVQRRSLAEPLRQDRIEEPAPIAAQHPVAQPAPQLVAQQVAAPAAAAAMPAQAAAPATAPAMDEPSLFENMPAAQAPAAEVVGEDGLPSPVYQPAPQQPQMMAAEEPAAFARPAPAGTPTPEAMERLRAAVNKAPLTEPAPRTPVAPISEQKPRFGINSLIGRMTGAAEEAPQPTRQQPQMSALQPSAEVDPEQEKIEIPAFLRRQAN
ncbi:MAG: cell division protein FtsZ [Pseudomonadota bacterium]